jgi:hypothetical protein
MFVLQVNFIIERNQVAQKHLKKHLKMNIQEVWEANLDVEMTNIRNIIERYPYVAMVSFINTRTLSFQVLLLDL